MVGVAELIVGVAQLIIGVTGMCKSQAKWRILQRGPTIGREGQPVVL